MIVLAGPNGAGKSTFYKAFLEASGLPFLNADVMQVNSGVDVYEAAKAVDEARSFFVRQGLSFITETVFSDPDGKKLAFLRIAMAAGYEVHLIYIGLESAELAKEQVALRTLHGGHNVPPEKVAARYPRSLANLAEAIMFVSRATLFDNSTPGKHLRIAEFRTGKLVKVCTDNVPVWAQRFIA